jgi:RND family efflux transporter MFP subunit
MRALRNKMTENDFTKSTVLFCCAILPAGLSQAADFDCLIKPYKVVEIHAPAVGLIEKVQVDLGDVVRTGQVLATLESNTEQASAELAGYRAQMTGPLATAEARAEHTGRKFGRKEELHKKGFVTTEDKDQARAEKKVAEAELREAHENKELAHYEHRRALAQLNLRTIKSPISGVVTERLLNPGEVAELGVGQKPILKIAQIDPLRIEVILPLQMYGQVREGAAVEIVPEAPIGGRYSATVQGADKVIDAASATFAVRLELQNANYALPAGVRCKADFLAGGEKKTDKIAKQPQTK